MGIDTLTRSIVELLGEVKEARSELAARPKAEETDWMSAREAARFLALPSARAVYQAASRGHFPSHRSATRQLRFSKEELNEVLLKRGR